MHKGWKKYKIGLLAEVQNGYAFKASDFAVRGIPIIKIKNIQPPNISFEDAQYFNGEISDHLNRFLIYKKDILISMTGSHISQISSAVGKVGRYGFDTPAFLNQRVGKLYSKDELQLNNDYLYYLIARPEVQFELATNAGGSANQANISPQQIKNLEFEIPDINAQIRIASILSSLDDKIELNRRMNQTLEQMAQALFNHYFLDNIDPANLPEGWRVGKLGEILSFRNGKSSPLRNNFSEFPVYGSNGIIGYCDLSNCKERSFIIGRVGSFCGSVYFTLQKAYVTDNAIIAEPIINNSSTFCYQLILSLNLNNFRGGSGQPLVNQSVLSNISILLPSIEQIHKYERTVLPFYERMFCNDREVKTLTMIRDTLLPKLMSGEIDVSELVKEELIVKEHPSIP